ncbi:MAG TPA: peptide-methionine (R)-S-oxide reductase MsrB [Phycisphaerae bacterium]|jgi:peptide-methionine (R)-S-oxide reductase
MPSNSDSTNPVTRTDAEWKKLLTPEQYKVLRQQGTEWPFTGAYTDKTDPGTYSCAACGAELFSSQHKFHSGCGWPSFYTSLAGDRVKLLQDTTRGVVRTEVTCARCGSHLGHVFDDAPKQPTGQRYCINSVALKFVPGPKT